MKRSSNPRPAKARPQRSCVACRLVTEKRDLIRLVRLPEGGIEIDITGKKAGRGAYLCRKEECWASALKSRRLEHTLRTTLGSEQRDRLLKQAADLFSGATG